MRQRQLPTCCGATLVYDFQYPWTHGSEVDLNATEARAVRYGNRTLAIATTVPTQGMDEILKEKVWILVLKFRNRNSANYVTLWTKALQGDPITFLVGEK